MPWARLDESFDKRPEVLAAIQREPAAALLHILALTYATHRRTGGIVDREDLFWWLDLMPYPVRKRTEILDVAIECELFTSLGNDEFRVNPMRPAAREPLTKSVRAMIVARDGFVCGLCGGPVGQSDVHIDHIRAVVHGGSDDPDNLQVTHSRCNLQKGSRLS